MAVGITPSDLAEAMACYQCIDPGRKPDALIVILQEMAGTSYTPDQLLELAKCYQCMDEARKWEIIAALLCVIAEATT